MVMAEEVGFEPTVDFHLRRFSRPVHSTTLPLLRLGPVTDCFLIRKATSCFGEIRRQNCLESFKMHPAALSFAKSAMFGLWPGKSQINFVWWAVTSSAGKQRKVSIKWDEKKGRMMTGTMMTGIKKFKKRTGPLALAVVGTVMFAGCDENGEFALSAEESAPIDTEEAARASLTSTTADVERPDLFDVTDRGLWDGRPSLGGVWVAHPDATDPERVMIRNPENGRSVVGALFRRERENPGPLLQVSSDAAEELGILAGAPTELSVIALRREETEVEDAAAEVNPVVASLAAPVTVEAAPLDPVDPVAGAAAAAIDTAEEGADAAVDVVLPAATAGVAAAAAVAATDDADDSDAAVDVSALLADAPVLAAAGEADLDGPQLQVGVFSVEANAVAGAQRLRDAGVPASVVVQQAGGRDVWRLVAGPAGVDGDPDTTLARIRGLGFSDAFLVGADADEEG